VKKDLIVAAAPKKLKVPIVAKSKRIEKPAKVSAKRKLAVK